jgi:hypothetical protein
VPIWPGTMNWFQVIFIHLYHLDFCILVKRLFGHSILARQELKQLKEKEAKEMADDKEEKNRAKQVIIISEKWIKLAQKIL